MNLGAWCLAAFSSVGAGAVGADVLGRRRTARGLGAVNALLGGYLGSYTGVLLAATAVPVWARSRVFLGPDLRLDRDGHGRRRHAAGARGGRSARGPPDPASRSHGWSTAAIAAELALSAANERRLGRAGDALSAGAAGRLMRTAKGLVVAGLALSLLGRRRDTTRVRHATGALYLAGGLAFRIAWVEAGKASARDDEAVALTARDRSTATARMPAVERPPGRAPLRAWSRTVGRASLAVERLLRRS